MVSINTLIYPIVILALFTAIGATRNDEDADDEILLDLLRMVSDKRHTAPYSRDQTVEDSDDTRYFLKHNEPSGMKAKAIIHADSSSYPIGMLTLVQKDPDSPVTILGTLAGVEPNTVHGFHVHETPLPSNQFNCTAAGAHFNPYGTLHGPIYARISGRHVGDLGNVMSTDRGTIKIRIRDSIIQLYNGTRSIVARTIVLHALPDDNGMGGFPDSSTTGHAGGRIACGVIKLSTSSPIVQPDVYKQRFY